MSIQHLDDGGVVYFDSEGLIQSHQIGDGVLHQVGIGNFCGELARHLIRELERQLQEAGRCILMVDGYDGGVMTNEFREAMTAWFRTHQDAVAHFLIRSKSQELALNIANRAMGVPRAKAYSCLGEWEAVGKREIRSFVRRPLSLPGDFEEARILATKSLVTGDGTKAPTFAKDALGTTDLIGFMVPELATRCLRGRLLIERRRFDEARNVLTEACDLAQRCGFGHFHWIASLFLADLELLVGADATARAVLERALGRERETGKIEAHWLSREVVAELCLEALEANHQVERVRALIQRQDLAFRAPLPYRVDSHSSCSLRVTTLGRAELAANGRTVSGTKVVELLFALLAMGPKVPRATLEAALWPDAEGDRAHGALKTTLHRLREAIGDRSVVQLVDGQLIIDSRSCGSDLVTAQDLMDQIEMSARGGTIETGTACALAEQLFHLYRGRFLPEHEAAWTNSVRERLHRRFLASVAILGQHVETQLLWNSALDIYERALLVDDLSEPLYRSIMRVYEKMGCPGEVLRTYERCHRVLLATTNVEPSAEARAILSRVSGSAAGG